MATVQFLFELEQTGDGAVRSSLKLLSVEDHFALQALPSGGLTQLPHALFLEALRREAYTMAISILSNGTKVEEIDAKVLDEHVRQHLLKMMELFSKPACEEALARIKSVG